jgi:hypothetical protein
MIIQDYQEQEASKEKLSATQICVKMFDTIAALHCQA